MYENIILTTLEHKNEASLFVQQYGGTVATSCTVFIEQNGSFSETSSSLTVCEAYGLKITEWYEKYESNEGNYTTTYNNSIIEHALSQAGIMVDPQTYIISLDGASSINISNEYDMLYSSAEILNRTPNLNVWIIGKDGHLRFYPKS